MADEVSAEDEAIRALIGTASFGKQNARSEIKVDLDTSKRITDITRHTASHDEDSDGNSDEGEDDDDEDEDDEDEFPVSHELVLKTHERAVTTMSIDPSGTRLITGSNDCTLKFHDFNGMTANTLRAFKSVDPAATKSSGTGDTHPIRTVAFNPHYPSRLLVVQALPQAKVFSRDGEQLIEFVKGDMYLRDLNNTKGHVAEITSGVWHPTDGGYCATAGADSTLRIWDIGDKRTQKDVIVYRSKVAGAAGRTKMTAIAWGSQVGGGPNILVGAALDGTLVMYSGEGPYTRPAAEVRDAHTKDTWTSGLAISGDGRMLVSRGGDDTVKLWDLRKFKQPISTQPYKSLSDQYQTANIEYAPNSSNIIMGSIEGDTLILNPATLRTELRTPVTPGQPIINVSWHGKLNQIFAGSANGETHVLYNPSISTGGAKVVMAKAPKKRHVDDDPNFTTNMSSGISADSIITPGGILNNPRSSRKPNTGLTASGKSRDPRRPFLPTVGPFAKNQPDEKHIRESIPLSSMRDEDPREALLKFADKAKNDPLFTNAWKDTQPKTIYAELSDEEEPDQKRQRR